MKALFLFPFLLGMAAAAQAQSSCSSDGQRVPSSLLERFINADCESCWRDPATAKAGPGALAIDWVAPGARGDDAPLAAVATRDARERLAAQARQRPATFDQATSTVEAPAARVRVAHGLPFNDYMGASIELQGRVPVGAWDAWLLLVEALPAGTEGSPVPRLLVRNVFRTTLKPSATGRLADTRPMRIPEGAKPERLRVVGWVQDARGRLRGMAMSRCAP